MIIDCIADLHGHYPKLEGGDLLIIAGDLTSRDSAKCWINFEKWISKTDYKKKIIIAGNHDSFLSSRENHLVCKYWNDVEITYLCDSGVNIFYDHSECTRFDEDTLNLKDLKRQKLKSLKIWGSPWTKTFGGMNPKCKAFTVDTEEELAQKFSLIPDDVDILVTHSPPFGMLDKTMYDDYVGSNSLNYKLLELKLKLHIFGHVHESYGECHQGYYSKSGNSISADLDQNNFIPMGHLSVNASHVNEHYKPVNKPVRVIL